MKRPRDPDGNRITDLARCGQDLTPKVRRELSVHALRAFFRIADEWALTDREQMKLLGLSDTRTLRRWRRDGISRLGRDALERISYILAIYERIHVLLPAPGRAAAWIRAANTAPGFAGHSVLDRMARGNVGDLYVVRQYLEAEVGGFVRDDDPTAWQGAET